MKLFRLFGLPDINDGIREFQETPGAILLDVRNPEEYRLGHIPGSRNVPLHTLPGVYMDLGDRETPVFVYCLSGGRSRQAAAFLQERGYTGVKDLGGIAAYTGQKEL